MDNFKIKSIDEFDLDFVAKYNEKNNNEISSVSNGPIPEIAKEENEEAFNYFSPVAENEQPISPAQNEETPQPYSPFGATFNNPDSFNNEPAKVKQSALAVVGKVISIILLSATIIVFVLGCFVTIFLDNHGSDLFGICFNTVSTDTYDSKGELIVSKGDLIISQKADASEYVAGKMIAVKSNSAGEGYYSDVYVITSVLSVSDTSAEITAINLASPGVTSTLTSEGTYGIVSSYLPALGTILHFTMDNAVLICILFVLLSAMWCLILVLIENQRSKKAKQ